MTYYERLFANSPTPTIVCDGSGSIREINHRAASLLQLEPDAVRGQALTDWVHPEDVTRVHSQWYDVDQHRSTGFCQIRLQTATGHTLCVRLECDRVSADGNGTRHYLMTLQPAPLPAEMDDKHPCQFAPHAELADVCQQPMPTSNAHTLLSLVGKTPVGICLTDEHGRFAYVNEAYCRLYGYSREELLGQPFTLVVPAEQRGALQKQHDRYIAGEAELSFECEVIRKDGERLEIACEAARLTDPQGRTLKATFVREITLSKYLLRQYETYFHAVNHVTTPICVTDADANIITVNPAFENLYGYPLQEARGNNPQLLNPGREAYRQQGYTDEQYDALFSAMWQDLHDPGKGHWRGEVINRKASGELCWVDLYASTIRGAGDKIIAYVASPVDLTDRRNHERRVRLECYNAINQLAATRDNETGGHLQRVSQYCRLLARELKLPQRFVQDIETFAPLHDIGKVGIRDDILLAPRQLNDDEFDIMKSHAEIGYRILRDRPTLEMAAAIARYHHERWDGNGYPEGLAGEDIPLAARIMALADVYDALRSFRHYKDAWTHEQTVAEIRRHSGTQFDPHIVEAFLICEHRFADIHESLADSTVSA